jgi:hypothetical protein
MSRLRTIGSVALVPVALLAIASSASATSLTSPAKTFYTGAVKAENAVENAVFHQGEETFTCKSLELEWQVESHGPSVTAKGPVTKFTLGTCSPTTVTVLKTGSLELHTGETEAGVLTWTGGEITTLSHSLLGTTHCIYSFGIPGTEFESIDVGVLTSSRSFEGSEKTAMIDIDTQIPAKKTDLFCPTELGMTAAYRVTSPDYLDVD